MSIYKNTPQYLHLNTGVYSFILQNEVWNLGLKLMMIAVITIGSS